MFIEGSINKAGIASQAHVQPGEFLYLTDDSYNNDDQLVKLLRYVDGTVEDAGFQWDTAEHDDLNAGGPLAQAPDTTPVIGRSSPFSPIDERYRAYYLERGPGSEEWLEKESLGLQPRTDMPLRKLDFQFDAASRLVGLFRQDYPDNPGPTDIYVTRTVGNETDVLISMHDVRSDREFLTVGDDAISLFYGNANDLLPNPSLFCERLETSGLIHEQMYTVVLDPELSSYQDLTSVVESADGRVVGTSTGHGGEFTNRDVQLLLLRVDPRFD
jgi:hypothetical protein